MSLEPDNNDKKQIPINRILLWIVVGAIGLYFVISGVYGILT
jgi:hypothetical protein